MTTGPDDPTTRLSTGSALDNLELGDQALPDDDADDDDDEQLVAESRLPWSRIGPEPHCDELIHFLGVHVEFAKAGIYQGAVLIFNQLPAGSGVVHAAQASIMGMTAALQLAIHNHAEACTPRFHEGRGQDDGDHPDPEVTRYVADADALWPFARMPGLVDRDLVATLMGAQQAAQQGAFHGVVLFASRMDTDLVLSTCGGFVHHRWVLTHLQMELMRYASIAFQANEQARQQQRLVQPVGAGAIPRISGPRG